MSNFNSIQQTIFRSLLEKIQLGFYDNNSFPSCKEIARLYQVSYCPAQRAFKKLEKNGAIVLSRGKSTTVLPKQYGCYLDNDVLERRAGALADMCETLRLIGPSFHFGHICNEGNETANQWVPFVEKEIESTYHYYLQIEQVVLSSGNEMIRSLFCDISLFSMRAFFNVLYGDDQGKDMNLPSLSENIVKNKGCDSQFHKLNSGFMHNCLAYHIEMELTKCEIYFKKVSKLSERNDLESFSWKPYRGRIIYREDAAIDILSQIMQGNYPVGIILPKTVLTEKYHISEITLYRTISLLNELGVVKNLNGIGTCVISTDISTIPFKQIKQILPVVVKMFQEAIQLLSITGETVLRFTFPYITNEYRMTIKKESDTEGQSNTWLDIIYILTQAIVSFCPLAAVCEIYRNLLVLIIKGKVLFLNDDRYGLNTGCSGIEKDIFDGIQSNDGSKTSKAFQELAERVFSSIQ